MINQCLPFGLHRGKVVGTHLTRCLSFCLVPLFVVRLIVRFVVMLSLAMLAQVASSNEGWQYKLDLGYGNRSDELAFVQNGQLSGALAGNTTKVIFAPDDIEQLNFGYRFISDNYWYVKGYFNKGRVYSGSMQQSSYQNGSENSPWAQYKAHGLRGSTSDTSVAIGKQIRWQQRHNNIAVTPLLGYANHSQHLQTTGGQQTVCSASGLQTCWLAAHASNNETGRWQSVWRGPWYGLDVRFNHEQWTWRLAWEHHRLHYDASLSFDNGQTLSGIKSIQQTGLGHGNRYVAGLAYWLGDGFLNVQIKRSMFDLSSGTSESTTTSGIASSQAIQSLAWNSQSVVFGYTGRF